MDGPDGPICQRTEIPVAWCAHCRPAHTSPRPRRKHHVHSRRPETRPTPREEEPIVALFHARWPGTCWRCGEDYLEETLVGQTGSGHCVCRDCL